MNIILWYLYIFCVSIIAVGNPNVLKIMYNNLNDEQLYQLRNDTTKYIWGINKDLSDQFNNEEKSHFQDVKKLLARFLCVMLLSTIYVYEYTKQTYFHFISLNLFLFVFRYILAYNFKSFWNIIHRPFFKSGTWMFPKDSLMIKCFPLHFWNKLVKNICIVFYGIILSAFVCSNIIN
jgi:Protein of unknown function (DUF1461)